MSKRIIRIFGVTALLFLIACATPPVIPTVAPSVPTAAAVTPSPVPATVPPTPSPLISPAGEPVTVTILHTNDMHGFLEGEKLTGGDGTTFEFGGIANAMGTVALLKQQAGANTLILDAGDFWQGTLASNRNEGRAIINAMNLVGYDALTLGNHDFDHGQEVLKTRAAQARFPFVAANILEEATGKPPAWVKPYIIKEVAGLRFGIIGLANSGTPVISKPSNSQGLKFLREVDAMRQVLPEVKTKSDLVVVLAHEGLDYDQRLAAEVSGIDVIVSGHTHVEQRQPKVVGSTIIVHAGYKAQYVGRLVLKIDPASKRIVDYTRSGEPVAAVSNKALPPKQVADEISNLVADARDAVNRPIGETQTDLLRQYTGDGRTTAEYPLGNLVVDAMLAANQAGDRPADLAMYNQGIRADLLKGTITYGKLYEVIPFDNVLTAMDLKGEDLKAILEIAASCPRVNTLVAGISFVYDCAKPQGSRVSNIRIKGQPWDAQKIYRVQTIDYLAGGGDGQTPFKNGTRLVYGDPMIDVVVDYVTKHSPLDLHAEGRIVLAGQ